jgi:hypothetical protein
MQDVRQRAYARGWIRDRFVPAPTAFGLDRLTFALARPLADRLRGQAERWRARPENVLLWSSSEGLFGVFLSGPGTDPELARTLAADGEGAVLYPVAVPAREEAVPVYFDFELAWVRANGLPGASAGYPRPIPEAPVGEDGTGRSAPSPVQRAALRASLAAREEHEAPVRPVWPVLGGTLEERSLRSGWSAFRCLLDPVALATLMTGMPGWCAFVLGSLRPSARPVELFSALVGAAGVSPFLFATQERRVLFASLARGPGTPAEPGRAPVLPTLQAYLQDITVVNWPLGTTRVLADHRYSRALAVGVRPPG